MANDYVAGYCFVSVLHVDQLEDNMAYAVIILQTAMMVTTGEGIALWGEPEHVHT